MFEHRFERLKNLHLLVAPNAKRAHRHSGVGLEVHVLRRNRQPHALSNDPRLTESVDFVYTDPACW